MFISLGRVLKSGLVSFWRNRWLSLATMSVMVLSLLVMTGLLFLNVFTDVVIAELQNKIDISVYFKLDTREDDIMAVQKELAGNSEVDTIEYVSRDEALRQFKERHQQNTILIEALDEVGRNPLKASLNVKARDPSQYASIASFLERPKFEALIDKVTYRQNATVIDRLIAIVDAIRRGGLAVTLGLAGVAVLMAFNTIRIAIYTAREEIGVMRLVGASNWFVRGPFLIEGVLYGLVAALVTLLISYPALYFLSPKIAPFLSGQNLFRYFTANVLAIVALEVAVGVALGAISSFIAIRRYLRV
ncbi:MAG: permease-like cell division protein FtsX [Patescibacteria group bacterium]|nr:permease-like cell division protein FtsX [Patescibacteria group bacterium]